MSSNGYITDHRLYDSNIADIATLKEILNKHGQTFGKDFAGAAADRAYYDEGLISVLEKKHKIALAIPHKKNRSAKISEAKRMYGLNKSYYKGYEGDKMWAELLV